MDVPLPEYREIIEKCVTKLADKLAALLQTQFILLGGASMVVRGSHRSTKDIDILVSEDTDLHLLQAALMRNKVLKKVGDDLLFADDTGNRSPITLDILVEAVDTIKFSKVP
ncbi:MAG: hypothetical protein M1819_001791 [Sarea resinae]|nr:MAG: hypothetical protein M1819_001791 [Sarea resinae]